MRAWPVRCAQSSDVCRPIEAKVTERAEKLVSNGFLGRLLSNSAHTVQYGPRTGPTPRLPIRSLIPLWIRCLQVKASLGLARVNATKRSKGELGPTFSTSARMLKKCFYIGD